jgi:hypothetical protein
MRNVGVSRRCVSGITGAAAPGPLVRTRLAAGPSVELGREANWKQQK